MFTLILRRIQALFVSSVAVAGLAVSSATIAADAPGVLSGAQEAPPVTR